MEERQDEQRMNCRIIDIHTHIYPVALARRAMEVTGHENDDFKKLPIRENLLARMREAGVDLSVNLPVVSKPQNQGEVNRFAKEAARKNIISFGGLHPDCENVIEELEKLLKNAEVVDEDEIDLDKVSIGCQVKVYDVDFDEEMEFKIVGSTEANSLQNKISNESPVGAALIGKSVGDVVDVETQAGVLQYKVLEIQRVS